MEQQPNLDKIFQKYTQIAKILPQKPCDEDLLFLYAHYKQATLGNCNIPQPNSWLDIKGKRKWECWNALNDMSRDDAKKKYIEKVIHLGTSHK